MKVIYHGHSGFSVRTQAHLLIFDYIGTDLTPPEKEDRAIAFVSHIHQDHFHPVIGDWLREGRVRAAADEAVPVGGAAVRPGDRLEIDGVRIEAFGSTDEGVSFLVHADGAAIFHAGDFNLWHWKNESDEAYVREAERLFEAVLDPLKGRHIDLAFFPVDPRMGEGHEEGALRFIGAVKPGVFIPMHFWDSPEAAEAMKKKETPAGVSVVVLTKPGETAEIPVGRGEEK